MALEPHNPAHELRKIAVFGNGLAGQMCVAKLVQDLPQNIEVVFVESPTPSGEDIFYGTVTSPSSYDFLLNIGITEPVLLPQTNTAFSLGTRYVNWGAERRNWTQSFHRPLPIFNGVPFHHYLTRLRNASPEMSDLDAHIISVQAANKGVFAHPPEGQKTPLADMEYGYQFMPSAWRDLLSETLKQTRVSRVSADVVSVERDGNQIKSVTLSDGKLITAEFFVDCLGPTSKLKHADAKYPSNRHLMAVSSVTPSTNLGDVCRSLTAKHYGWKSETPLQTGLHRLTIYEPDSEPAALADHAGFDGPPVKMPIGFVDTPWAGNCLTLGLGASALEPLTPAPMMLLQRDLDRLVELIPVSADMKVEAREYNRRFTDDYSHAALFHAAFFTSQPLEDSAYHQAAAAHPLPDKLLAKIEQFKTRGVMVQYDYEPFSQEDWTQLHIGMGRVPSRYDPLADRVSEGQLKNKLQQMSGAIDMVTSKMPPHHIYMSGLLRYLKEKHG
ncbi:tryptophan halogenase [Litorimonas cladophorae]|uniref:Tryptophan halogenase n=1 Tax=Litorimonas cladophorae TaxID=1220491 RepID=A0A918KBH2_9PROT|nr:tryptophan 7-halogenase [Litorimonas cladophorae]GGX57128.1 tryptophan halogenase [Litorimonas cladophorae]